jgi:HSP90 family molecular chaperone
MTVQDQETFGFQAEVVQLLDLMINSLYSNKEIFLRELISNASDAIDRLRLELLSRGEDPEEEGPLQIRVSYDKDAATITVADNGIGMSRAEVIEHIGTIAKSGTREFFQALTGDQRKDTTLIGQFGVGFYSSFIVAERVELTTRRAGLGADQGVRWASDGRGEYTLEAAERPSRGTTVVLHLRDGEDDLLSGYQLRAIIRKYSDHISLPIVMPAERTDQDAGSAPAADETVNQASALWTRPKNEISDQDYNEFYRHISGDYTDPLSWVHSKIEGTYEYTLLLFIPSHAPFDLWILDSPRGIRLHVRRIFIMEDSGQLLPRYLRFIRGVIDSADLPLNVSRERVEGTAARQPGGGPDPLQRGQEGAAAAEGHGRERTGHVRHLLEGVRRRPEGGHRRGLRQPGRDRPAGALQHHPGRGGRHSRRLHGADDGGPGEDLLPAGADPGRRQQQPAPGGLPRQGRRGAAPDRPGGQLGGHQPARVRGQATAVGRAGAG